MNDPTDSYSALAEEEAAQQMAFDDKELADKVVALGVGKKIDWLYHLKAPETAERFVRDWRVAGALMEKCNNGKFAAHNEGWVAFTGKVRNSKTYESLPRAIIEACCAALEDA